MKRNDRKNLSNSYLMTFPQIKEVEERDADAAELGDYFSDTDISVYFAIPDEEDKDEFIGLKISYPLRIQLTEENKYDITHDDLSSCRIIIYKRYNPINFNTDTIYSTLVTEKKFSSFVADCSTTIDEYFQRINEQTFFDFKVRKNKVLLNKNLIKYVQKRIFSDLNKTVQLLEKGDDDALFEIHKGSELEMDRIEALAFTIKKAEKQFEYNELTVEFNNELISEINNNLGNSTAIKKRVKI